MPYPTNNALNAAIDAVNSGSVFAVYSFNEASGTTMEADVGPDGTYSGTHDYEEYGGIVCDSTEKSILFTDGAAVAQTTGFRLPATGAMSLYWRCMWQGEGTSRVVMQQGTGPTGDIDMYYDSAGRVQARYNGGTSITAAGSLDNAVGPSFRDFFLVRASTGRFTLYWEDGSVAVAGAAGADSLSIDDEDFQIFDNASGKLWMTKLAFWDGYALTTTDIADIHAAATNTLGGPSTTVSQCRSHTCFFIGGPVDGTKWVNVADRLPLGANSLYHDMDLTGSPTVVGASTDDINGFATDDSDTMYARHPHDGDITDDPDELVVIDATNPLTILMRVTINDLSGSSYLFNINDSTATNTADLNAYVLATTGEVRIRSGGTNKLTGGNLVAGAPSNIAMTEDASGSLVIDGVEVDTSGVIAYQSGYLQVGKREGVATTLLNGTVHFFAVFGEVLTLAEQNAIFATVTGTHHWRDRLFTRRSAPPRPRAIRTRPKPRGRLMPRRRGT